VAVFSSSRDGYLKYLLRSIIEQSFAGETLVKILTDESWYTNLVIRNLGDLPYSIKIEIIGGCKLKNFEKTALSLFLNSEADFFIPTFPNQYWISSSKIDQHATAHQRGMQYSWHPVVSRNLLNSTLSTEQWGILNFPTSSGTAVSRAAFGSDTQSMQTLLNSLVVASTQEFQVQKLKFPMVQIHRFRQKPFILERLRRVWLAYKGV
jgi:hypothetical protein